jgi:phosphoglycerol transferase MdoB-like AlkP superfamily enzyme
MTYSRRSVRVGALLSFVLFALIAVQVDKFLELETWGPVLYGISLGAALLVWPFVAIGWETPRWFRGLTMTLLFFWVPMGMLIAVERLNGNFITGFLTGQEDVLANYVVYLLFYLLAFGLSGSLRVSVLTVSPILLLFGIANMYVKEFKGSPLVPMDLGSIRTAANVAAGYTYEIGYEMLFALAVTAALVALFCHLKPNRKSRVGRWIVRILSLVVVLAFAYTFYYTDTIADYGLKPDFFNQTRGYKNHGAVLEFTLNTKYLWLKEPSGYDPDQVTAIVETPAEDGTDNILETALIRQGMDPEEAQEQVEAVPTAGEQGITPNLVVIMNESFSDLRVVGDIETNIPFMPYLDSLTENTIQGNVYVSTIGTGTSNTEYEFLTGNTMAFLPAGSNAYQLYVKNQQPGLVSTLLAQGYTADALHPYYESSWNRAAVYELMGFRDFITIEDLIDQDILDRYKSSGYNYSLYKRLLRQRYPGESIILRRYVSDAYDFQKIQELYETKGDEPFFLFNVTMQSHSSYNQTYDNFDQQVYLTSTEGDYPKTDQYLSLIKETDSAFQDLVEYFSQVEEPTIVLMFGDHQPFIEDSFYAEVMGQSVSDMDDETQQKRYITRFVLWANYDIPEGWIDEISMNYLSTLLLQVAGLPMTDYNRYLADLYTELPVITAMGCRDAEGDFFQADERNPIEDVIQDYRTVAYNNLADAKHRKDSLFYLETAEGETTP